MRAGKNPIQPNGCEDILESGQSLFIHGGRVMRKSTCLLIAFGIMLFAATASFAQPGGKGGPGGFGGFGKKKGFDGEPGIPLAGLAQPKVTRWEYRIESGA